jgi:hypothetical protein
MNQVSAISEARAARFSAIDFAAFKVSETGRTYELGPVDASNVPDAVNAALGQFVLHHKEHLLIRETSERGSTLHIYSIRRKSAPRWVHKDHVPRAVHDLYADAVCSIDGNVFQQSTRDGRGIVTASGE